MTPEEAKELRESCTRFHDADVALRTVVLTSDQRAVQIGEEYLAAQQNHKRVIKKLTRVK